MTTTVGRVNFTARIDGRRTPRDAENIGRRAGAAGAEGYDETWSKGIEDSLTKAGQDSLRRWRKNGANDGTIYGREINRTMKKFLKQAEVDVAGLRLRPGFMDDYSKKFDDAGLAARGMQNNLIELRRQGTITDQVFQASRRQVDEWVGSQRRAAIETNNHRDAVAKLNDDILNQKALFRDSSTSIDRHTRSMERSTVATKKQGLAWGDIPHNGRQAILITAAIAAGAQDIAVLGSAAGAGIVALGGGLAQFGIGAGSAVAVLTRLNQDIDKLPASMRPVAREFQEFKGVFGELADSIASSAFRNMNGTFDSLRDSVSALTPAFEKVGDAVGRLFRDFADSVKPGSEALDEINELVENSAGGFDSLMRSAGTLGGALVRSFNRAQPLIEDMYGWIDQLVTRFDDFTRSDGFDEWVRRAQSVFGSLGPLIDSVGRALNDLVTPESTQRTIEFLDNLTGFMPNLSALLDVIGRLDVFGIAAQLLNELGRALEPLGPPMGELADGIRNLVMDLLPPLADVLRVVAEVLAPVVQGFANLVNAIPPEFVQVLVGVAGGLALLKGASGLAGLATQFGLSSAAAKTFQGNVTAMGGAVRGALGKAGAVGLAASAVFILGDALQDQLTPSLTEVTARLKDVSDELDVMALAGEAIGPSMGNMLTDLREGAIGAGREMGIFGDNVTGLAVDLEAMRGPMGGFLGFMDDIGVPLTGSIEKVQGLSDSFATLASSDMPAATDAFRSLVEQQKLTEGQAEALIGRMGSFRDELINQASAMGVAITDQNLLSIAMGETRFAADSTKAGLDGITASGLLTNDQINALSESIRNFGNDNLTARESARQYEAGLDELTQSIIENGNTLDINTAKGRANEAAIDAVAQSVLQHSANTLKNTGDQKAANAVISEGRNRLMDQLKAFGMTKDEAARYVDELGLIPPSVRTKTVLDGVQGALNQLAELTRPRSVRISTIMDGAGLNVNGKIVTPYARGTITSGPEHALIGEAGPEAVVPLNRPLSQVDPSVRWLSAIAQNKPVPMASGGVVGAGRTVNINEGAIVVQGAADPRQVAYEVADLIAERIGS